MKQQIGGSFSSHTEDGEGTNGKFSSITDYALFLARHHGLLKNDKTLLVSLDEVLVKMSLLISKDSFDGEFQVSDVLDAVRNLSKPDSENEHTKKYRSEMRKDNLTDGWTLFKLLQDKLGEIDFQVQEDVLVVLESLPKHDPTIELVKLLFRKAQLFHAQLEIPFDTSIDGITNKEAVNITTNEIESLDHLSLSEYRRPEEHFTSEFCLQTVRSYLKLLINSRDELSLARIISSGPNSFLDHKAFTILKREAAKTRMVKIRIL